MVTLHYDINVLSFEGRCFCSSFSCGLLVLGSVFLFPIYELRELCWWLIQIVSLIVGWNSLKFAVVWSGSQAYESDIGVGGCIIDVLFKWWRIGICIVIVFSGILWFVHCRTILIYCQSRFNALHFAMYKFSIRNFLVSSDNRTDFPVFARTVRPVSLQLSFLFSDMCEAFFYHICVLHFLLLLLNFRSSWLRRLSSTRWNLILQNNIHWFWRLISC